MLTILYGSETGNAQDYAEYLAVRLRYYGVKSHVSAFDDFPLERLITDTKLLVLICLTTGQGLLPRNARQLFRFLLRDDLPLDFLDHIQFTLFGLGDSLYSRFNWAIRKIHKRFLQLGAQEFLPRCEADEMGELGPDGFYKEWEAKLVERLGSKLMRNLTYNDTQPVTPATTIAVDSNQSIDLAHQLENTKLAGDLSLTRSELSQAKVLENTRATTPDHFQDIRHVVLESTTPISYVAGDTCALYPVNDDQSVQDFLEAQPHWLAVADKPLIFKGDPPQADGGMIDLKGVTLRQLVKYHLDIWSIPKRALFAHLWHFVDGSTEDGERERDKLKEFSELEYPDEIYDYANRPRRLILETVQEFLNNMTIPLEYVWEIFPKIRSRQFSIALAPNGNRVELVIGVVEYRTILRRLRRGLCTKWLKDQVSEGDTIVFSLAQMGLQFKLPDNPAPPLIMVAPGTGIAPMRALTQTVAKSNPKQEMHLFYGVRNEEKDFLFSKEWKHFQETTNFTLHPCFSRQEGYKPRYVQDGLWLNKEKVAELILKKEAIFYVCGALGNMPKQTKLTMTEIIKESGVAEAEKYVKDMEDNGRYLEDVW